MGFSLKKKEEKRHQIQLLLLLEPHSIENSFFYWPFITMMTLQYNRNVDRS